MGMIGGVAVDGTTVGIVVQAGVTFGVGIIGVAVGYGRLRAQVASLSLDLNELKHKHQGLTNAVRWWLTSKENLSVHEINDILNGGS